jgi:HSP20 family protein
MDITDLIPWKRGKKVPVRRGEERSLPAVQQDMNRWFDDFFGGFGLTPFHAFFDEPWETFSPKVNVVEGDKEIKVSAELPGMDEKDINVSLSHGVLTINGEKKEEEEHKGKNYYRLERSYGSFQRSIPLPCEVDDSKVEAVFKKGVLTITLPKTPATLAGKKITVKAR